MAQSLAVRRSGDPAILKNNSAAVARVNEVLGTFADRDHNGEIVTAVRRFPARAAEFAEWPEWVHAGTARRVSGKTLSGRTGTRPQPRKRCTPAKYGDCYADCVGKNALLQPAGDQRDSGKRRYARVVFVSDQSVGARPVGGTYDVNQRLENRFGIMCEK